MNLPLPGRGRWKISPRDWSLANKLSAIIALCVLVPFGIAAVYQYQTARGDLIEEAREDCLQAARSTAHLLDTYLAELAAESRMLAAVPEIQRALGPHPSQENQTAAESLLREAKLQFGFDGAYLVHRSGTVVLSADRRLVGRSYIAAHWFQTAIGGEASLDEPRYDRDERQVYLHFSVPVRNSGPIAGVLVGRLAMDGIDRIIAAAFPHPGRGRYGVLWDERGVRISHGREPSLRFRPFAALPADVAGAMISEQRYGPATAELLQPQGPDPNVVRQSKLLLYDRNGDPYLRHDSPVAGLTIMAIAPLESRRFLLGALVPEAKVLSTARAMAWQSVLAILAAMLSAALAAAALARWLTRPLEAVARVARALGAGDMSGRVGMTRNDEVGRLAATIDTMADALVARTAELEAARERERAEEVRKSSEQRYLSLVRNAVFGIYRCSADGALVAANPALIEMLGYASEADLLSGAAQSATLHHTRLLQSLRADGVIYGFETEWQRKDGTAITVRLSGRAVLAEDGTIAELDMIAEDVSQNVALEDRLRQAQKMEAVGRLAGGVAHDFNNLLTVINGYSDLALARLAEGEQLRKPLTEIRSAGERAAELTKQLLAFSRRQPVMPKPLDMNQVIAESRDMLKRILGEDIEFTAGLAPSLGRVMADSGQIHQVLINLTVNARDAMPGGGTFTIETTDVDLDEKWTVARPDLPPGPYVLLAASDTGTGMDKETRTHIFEPFFTTKRVGEGTGLGLATVFGIVRQCGGSIEVWSEPGRGSCFRIYLPRLAAAPAAAEAQEAGPETSRGWETILVVEDQDNVRDLTTAILKGYGYRVLDAPNGGAALLLAERHEGPIHLLLTDVVMPLMTGKELAERLVPVRPETRILFMSGYTFDVVARRGIPGSAVDFIVKPFTPDALARKVRTVLGTSGPERPAAQPASPGSPSERTCVLVADDTPLIRRIFAEILQAAGFDVVEAADGNEARRQLDAVRVDVALMDLNMPGQLDLDARRELRRQHPDLRVVLMSAAFDKTPVDGESLGVDLVLGKPIDPQLLVETVRRLALGASAAEP